MCCKLILTHTVVCDVSDMVGTDTKEPIQSLNLLSRQSNIYLHHFYIQFLTITKRPSFSVQSFFYTCICTYTYRHNKAHIWVTWRWANLNTGIKTNHLVAGFQIVGGPFKHKFSFHPIPIYSIPFYSHLNHRATHSVTLDYSLVSYQFNLKCGPIFCRSVQLKMKHSIGD